MADPDAPLPDAPTAAERRVAAVLTAAAAAAVVALGPFSEAVASRSTAAALEAVAWDAWREVLAGWEPLLIAEYLTTVEAAAAGIPAVTFDATALARAWGYEHAAALVTAVTDTTREAVRAIIIDGIGKGRSMDAVAGEVRQVVGLHPRWATAVVNYRRRLTAAGRPAAQVERMTGTYSRKLLRARAMNIARWEVQDARNMGRWRTWKEGQAAGAFPAEQRKAWHAETPTACPRCVDLENEAPVGLDEPFSNGRLMPPDHVRCRCTAVLVD
jgi:hypothetical protein